MKLEVLGKQKIKTVWPKKILELILIQNKEMPRT